MEEKVKWNRGGWKCRGSVHRHFEFLCYPRAREREGCGAVGSRCEEHAIGWWGTVHDCFYVAGVRVGKRNKYLVYSRARIPSANNCKLSSVWVILGQRVHGFPRICDLERDERHVTIHLDKNVRHRLKNAGVRTKQREV
jgi:hypothetical protein